MIVLKLLAIFLTKLSSLLAGWAIFGQPAQRNPVRFAQRADEDSDTEQTRHAAAERLAQEARIQEDERQA